MLTDIEARAARHVLTMLISAMDTKFPHRWDMWRAYDGRWVVRAELEQQKYEEGGPCMIEALRDALAWMPLPLVPKRPRRLDMERFAVKRAGSKWELQYDGEPVCWQATKRDSLNFAERAAERSCAEADDWEREYGWTLHKIENVDFQYET